MVEFSALSPIIVVLLVVGFATSIFQLIFQIEDTAFSLLPKLMIMILIGVFGGFGAIGCFERLAIFWIGHASIFVHQTWS